jgi:iron complex outermembrane receptor protein
MSESNYFIAAATILISALFPSMIWANEISQKERLGKLLAMSLEELIEVEVVLATGTPKPIYLAPAIANVITAQEIQDIGATTLNEVLETVPGLHVVPSSKGNMRPVYSVRGIHTSLNPQVLLLVNGYPIKDTYTGGRPNGFMMPVTNISRIEIIRGPGSAVYGADAFAATINVITKDGQELAGTETGLRHGSFNATDVWLQHGGEYKGWNVGLSLTGMKSDGDKDRIIDADLQTTLDRAMGTRASLAPGALDSSYELLDIQTAFLKDNWTLNLWGQVNNNQGLGDGVTQIVSSDSFVDYRQYLADLTYHNDKLISDTDLKVQFTYFYIYQASYLQLFPAGSLLPIGSDGNVDFVAPAGVTLFSAGVFGAPVVIENQTAIECSTVYNGWEKQRWRLATGYSYLHEEHEEKKNFGPSILDGSQPVVDGTLTDVSGTPYIFMQDQTRNLFFVSLQDEWIFMPKWELIAGVRYDVYSDFDSTMNPRLALVWETRNDLSTKLMYGRAFRPPSFNELYVKNNPANNGNPDLEPETIETLELAFDYRPLKTFRMAVNFFVYEIEDLIELVPDAGQATQTSQNHKDQEGHGFEIETAWKMSDTLIVKGNVAYQRAEDSTTKEIVPEAPELQFYANVNWEFQPNWSLDGQYFWIGGRHRAAADPRPAIDDYSLVNIALRRQQIFQHWDAALAVRNLLDEDIREPSQAVIPNDYPMESRAIWLELRYFFN